MLDLIICDGSVFTPKGVIKSDIGLKDGLIAQVGDLKNQAAQQTLSAKGAHILPGVIDTQVHFREPGFPDKETLETGSQAAVMGGVTGVFEMPNTMPPTTSLETFQDKLKRAAKMWCNYAFYVGYDGHNLDILKKIVTMPGCCGVKVFMGSSTGTLLVDNEEALEALLREIDAPIAVHAEDEHRLQERKSYIKERHPETHSIWRDATAAFMATQRIVRLARQVGRKGKLHILHVTSREEVLFLAQNKDIVSFEVTPQHLTLWAPDCYERLGTLAQMNPPIRDKDHQKALLDALSMGAIDVIGSDHAPHTLAEKAYQYPKSPSGMPGVQTLVPLMLDHMNKGHLSLEQFVALTSGHAVRLFGLQDIGSIEVGKKAHLTIVDLKREETIQEEWLKSKCGWSPFSGMTVKGWPMGTIIHGALAMWDGQLMGKAQGRPLIG